MYRVLQKAMLKAFPENAGVANFKWHVMEDNDPAGHKSSMAESCKKALGIKVRTMPPRSPDLNVLDYSLWSEISKRMRRQEQDFHNNK